MLHGFPGLDADSQPTVRSVNNYEWLSRPKKNFVPTFSLKLLRFLSEIVVCFCDKIFFWYSVFVFKKKKKKKNRFGTAKVERPQKLRETLGKGLSTILFLIGRFIGRQNWQLWVLETSLFFTGRNEC